MLICRRSVLAGVGASTLATLGGGRLAFAKDKLTEANMTKRDYEQITQTRSSVEGEDPVTPPTPVHDFSQSNSDAVKEEHGVRLLKGKEWKDKTPEERDQYLRDARRTLPEGARLVITVPKGEVWVIPPEAYDKLARDQAIRPWTDEERARIPESVARGEGASHSDISGTFRPMIRVEIKP